MNMTSSSLPPNFQELEQNAASLYSILPHLNVIGKFDSKFQCSGCQKLMIHVYGSCCGHHFCGICIKNILDGSKQKCPACGVAFHDRKIRRNSAETLIEGEIWNLLVRCPYKCNHECRLRDVMSHVKLCNMRLNGSSLSPVRKGPQKGALRIKLSSESVTRTEFDNLKEEFVKKFSEMEAEITRLKQVNVDIESQVMKLRQEVQFLFTFLQDNPQARQCLLKGLSTSVEKDKQSEIQSASSCTSSTNGSITWRISSYLDVEQRAQSGQGQRLTSDPFYSSKEGYKFRVEVYPNGLGSGAGTHLSVGIAWLKGEHDYLLSWPLLAQVNLVLVDKLQQSLETNVPIKVECLHNDSQYYCIERAFKLEDVHKTEAYMLDDCVCLMVIIKPFALQS